MPVPNLVRPCLNEAVARAPRLMERAIDEAVAALEAEAARRAGANWRDHQAAARALAGRRAALLDRFPRQLRAALEHPAPAAGSGGGMRPSSLTLVDDAELMQSIESARLAQAVSGPVDGARAELDGLMSAALGLDGIQPEHNPLRVEVFTTTLRAVLADPAPEQPGWPALWMRHMAEPVAHDLVRIYQAASKLLQQAGVTTAGYRLLTAAAPLARASRAAPLETPSRAAALAAARPATGFGAWVGTALQALRGPLLRDFLGGQALSSGQLPLQQPLDAGWYARVDAELASLESGPEEDRYDAGAAARHAHLPPVERPARAVGTRLPLDDAQWGEYGAPRQRSLVRTRLKQQARQVGQAVGLEVVRQLLDEVAQDPRLLAPVREAIVALEPALARLALHSPQFFGDAAHPARRLLERVAERSFRFNDEFAEPFQQFFGPVRDGFNALIRLEPLQDPQPFAAALATLEDGWSRQDRDDEAARQRMLEAVRQAEVRQQEAERIAWDLSQRSDLAGAPALVQDFLFTQWALVVAQARLQGAGGVDPGGYLGVVSDLLWSVKRETALRDPARAFVAIPRVLGKLREGMALLGQPPEDTQSFFAALEQLHRPVLKLRARHRQQAFEAPTAAVADEAQLQPAAARKPQEAPALWLAPGESQACGFGDTVLVDEPPVPDAAPAAGHLLSAAEAEAVIEQLAEGTWVDLHARQQWRRARLVWTGTRRTLFMFVGEGGQPHSMTRRSLQRLVAGRLLRPIEAHAVVQHAIDALSKPQPQPLAA
ncbi:MULTISPECIES: DUF1631 family protein [Ramlibacter]|uniref:DUF1631 family protein n=1 Tax=Ramlibacter pinisoli TaxID=2682844 RepID=A0A6N8IVN9_9BURK|nr:MULTISPECIES: DUF1631 family protein [Ramlibacter]MBA2965659.1 DUF1631 family protein [Ramlibacter sp. CGMCC 1.13660]MVQ30625.1 DUF1631 family protein [Ramlibacter pinisoli]